MSTLREIIDEKAVMAKTKRLDLSFNEILSLYQDGELEIKPAFQRVFVWTDIKQSQFIESLLLELPIPPIYVVEIEEGKYVLVDGLQRISTYLHFRGELENPFKNIKKGDFLKLTGCDIAPELNDKSWNDLDTALQIRLKRSFVSVQVIRRESDSGLKFHMFKRLNDGGTPISAQQVRNCVIRMLEKGTRIMDLADELSRNPDYISSCVEALTQEQTNEQFDQELILRFFALKNNLSNFKHHVGIFIDSFVESIAGADETAIAFDVANERQIFESTFKILAKSTGEYSFTFPNKSRTELTRGFSAYHFEGVTLGLQDHLSRLDPEDEKQMGLLAVTLRTARLSDAFYGVSSGGGKNSPGPLNSRISIIRDAVASII